MASFARLKRRSFRRLAKGLGDPRNGRTARTRRFPNPRGDGLPAEIEGRPLQVLDDFPPSESIERFRQLGGGS